MKTISRSLLLVSVLFATLAPGTSAQPYTVELDLDGQVGNGPDHMGAGVSDYIDVNVWIMGSGAPLFSSYFMLCNLDGSLEFQGFTSMIPPPWTHTPPQTGTVCFQMQDTDFTYSAPIAVPFQQGVVTYHCAVNGSLGDITIDTSASGWFTSGFESGFYQAINASVQIGGTATEQTVWGSVKELFR